MRQKILGLTAAAVALLILSGCQKAEESSMDKAADFVGDVTDTRDNEKLKDAGEDAKDAMENAAEGMSETLNMDEQQ